MSEAGPGLIASAFHPQAGSDAVEGQVVVDRWRLRFESPVLILELPLNRLVLEVEESAGGRVCFSDPEQPDCWIATYDSRILREHHLRAAPNTRAQIRSFENRGQLQRHLKLTLGFVVGFIVLAMLASMFLGLMVRLLVAQVPLPWEQQMGDSLLGQERQEMAFLDDTNLMLRLTNAVAPLIAALPADGRRYDFYLADEDEPNAFALPGGHVIVTRGLMDLADRPEQLAAVTAHEIAHVTQRHLFRKVVSSAGPLVVCRLFAGSRSGVLGLLGASSQLLVVQSFSQEYELEADAVGWDYLVAAHIDPRAAPEILRKIEAVESADLFGAMPRALSSHPDTEKRIRGLEAKWKKLKNKAEFTAKTPAE